MTDSKELCKDCALCCKYVTIELEEPSSFDDVDEIAWFLMHKNMVVYIDSKNIWNLEVRNECKSLDSHGLCTSYTIRPDVCKDYSHTECEKYVDKDYYKTLFEKREDILAWAEKKGIKK